MRFDTVENETPTLYGIQRKSLTFTKPYRTAHWGAMNIEQFATNTARDACPEALFS